jgi:hypothetical protein
MFAVQGTFCWIIAELPEEDPGVSGVLAAGGSG